MRIQEKPTLVVGGLTALFLSSLLITFFITKRNTNAGRSTLLTPLAAEDSAPEAQEASPSARLTNPFHLLLLGLDKRFPEQKHFRTDTIMVVSILKDIQKILLTSIPRDLWLDGAKINTFFSQGGFSSIKKFLLPRRFLQYQEESTNGHRASAYPLRSHRLYRHRVGGGPN